ncbi:FAD-binding oxidoreductase [Zooshikella harenae]|uniref:FAD-binding oxidoreductase n=1 Tax=Zooshikella harenae TaxID=2827238 RepID=A0ABS5ZFK0_9GAMM|nr:FAD-binding oxidoreductase [Zooshikella harenae]MBU2712548.1 FAD-binding oxidoreductase [Zooshikella harenae]
MSQAEIIAQLKDVIVEGKILTDAESLSYYGKDWTKAYKPAPLAIVFPRSIPEVQALVRFANKHNVALVASGGRTGLSGGAVAAAGEVVVAFDYMNNITDFNPIDRTVICEPGVITEQLQAFAEERELFYPVDFASAGSSQMGGNISTNAGGIKVIRYGMTRDWVAGLKVVTGTGELLSLNKALVKNNTGYDLRQLFIGGEGTLGFIVEATMKLVRPPKDLTVLLLGVSDMTSIMNVLHSFQQQIDLTAFEFFSEKALQKVVAKGDVQRPFETQVDYYALLEFECLNEQIAEQAMEVFELCLEQGWVMDGVMSQSLTQLQNLWRCREDISETIAEWTPYKNDISVIVSKVPEFLAEVERVVTEHYPDFEIIWFGHIGDGNIHLNILKPEQLDQASFIEKCHHVSQWVFEIVEKYQGSVSAEHGVGLLKKDFLQYTRSAVEIEYMKAIKCIFDPNNIMNPGKLIDL